MTTDTMKMYGLFNAGKMAMIVTGPGQLSTIAEPHVSYGVQVMPSYGAQVTAKEAWDLVNYIRHMQSTSPR